MTRLRSVLRPGISLGFAIAAVAARRFELPPALVEGLLILGVLSYVAFYPPLLRLLRRGTAYHRLLAGSFVTLVLVGDLVLNTASFPFVVWHMYGTIPRGDPFVYELIGEARSGERVVLSPSGVLSDALGDALVSRLYVQIGLLRLNQDGQDAIDVRREHQATLVALGHAYNRSATQDPLVRILVSTRTIPLGSTAPTAPAEVLWTVPVL